MVLYLEEDEYFSMNAYVQTPGEQTVALSGFLVDRRSDGTYVAPLIPDLFYGADGNPLSHSWRQNFTATGDQTILSRSGGQPSVPRNQLYWRKIKETEQPKVEQPVTPVVLVEALNPWIIPVTVLGIGLAFYVGYKILK